MPSIDTADQTAPAPAPVDAFKATDEVPPSIHRAAIDWTDLARIGIVAVGALLVWFRAWEPFPRWSVIGLGAAVVGGWPIYREALENLLERKMTMELSMT